MKFRASLAAMCLLKMNDYVIYAIQGGDFDCLNSN